MSRKVDKLAGKIATRMLRGSSIAKSAGSTAAVMPFAIAVAELIVTIEKRLKVNGRLLEENGRRIAKLAEAHGVGVRPVTEIQRGIVDMDLERFGVGLVDRQAAPKAANGHYRGDGVESSAAPLWHPENPGGV